VSFREQLHAYIAGVEKRLRWSTVLRGAAILTASALAATLVLVAIANTRAFSQGSITWSRLALILILAGAAGAGLGVPLRRLTRRRAVGTAESAFPQFEQRLTTFLERDGQDPFVELLAGDTLEVARSAQPREMVSDFRLRSSFAVGAGSLAALIWVIAAGPGYLGYGASLLWTGPHRDKPPIYDLRVTPGDVTVRRYADQMVSALPTGLKSPSVKLHARFQSSGKWEEIIMQPKAASSFAGGYEFLFAGLPENVEYYVTAGAMTSKHFQIHVSDLPAVKQIRVTYRFPAWTGMPPEIEERGGDLRAVAGTEAELEIATDRPLESGQILIDNGKPLRLMAGPDHVYRGTVKMDKDGVYHVAGVADGQPVRVSEDFYIEARKADPPQIALVRPGRGDYHANPIEEVTVAAKATDEYGLRNVTLHYSVNGGPETTVDLLPKKGEKQADGSATLSLEQFKLAPGDLISVYATAADAIAEAHTDMTFVQADPFEREFSQSQDSGGGGGGGGGGGNQQAQISQREKEIISATFRQQSDKNSTAQQAADIAKLLSQSQATLRDQAMTLSGRLEARELTDEVEAINDFQKDMIAAAEAMTPAARDLQHEGWKEALPSEQKALQYLLRAEATFRQIQVAFGQRGGGGSGGAARDLAALFDLELDTEKNQYESRSQTSTTEEQKQQEIDDELKKLDELAKRQDELAQQQRNGQQTAEQKWQQEMLEREAQQLQRQMEQQLSQGTQQGQSGQSGKSGQSASGASGGQPGSASSANSQQSADAAAQMRQQAAQQALDRLRQANQDMQRAAFGNASSADSRRAAERLREAGDLLGETQQQDAAGRINQMAQTADRLASEQKRQADRVRDLINRQNSARNSGQQPTNPTAQEIDKMVSDRQQTTDELARLTQQIRGTARELAPTQPAASGKLRSALDGLGLDENDLNTRMQRSSDWLRGGDFSDQAESRLTNDLQNLGQELRDAAHAVGAGQQQATQEASIKRAMDNLSRLRDQLAGLSGRGNPPAGQALNGRGGQAENQQGQDGQLSRNGQSGQAGQNGGGAPGGRENGPMGNQLAGAGGERRGQVLDNLDTGNTHIAGQAVAPHQGPNPADTQREIEQGLDLLNQVRRAVQESPEARQQVLALIDEMRNLDPKRFPGNPALVEQMHQQLLSGVDALELQLGRQLDQSKGGTIRNTDPSKVPAGYQDSVAEYYRKLSGGK